MTSSSLTPAFVLLRAGHDEDARIPLRDRLGLGAHASCHDDLAVAGERFADRGKRLRLRAVEEAAGVDDGEIGAFVSAGEFIAFRPQAGNDALAVHQRLGTAQRDETHLRGAEIVHRWTGLMRRGAR